MSQEKIVFSLVGSNDGVQVEVEGSGRELMELLASVMVESEEILTITEMALIAAKMEKKSGGINELTEAYLTKNKPKAQA